MELRIERDIVAIGGVAKLSELIDLGHSVEFVRVLSDYGRLTKVRKGWYARRDAPAQAVRAWRVGGRLACVSALHHLGLTSSPPGELHVAVRANASRLRTLLGYCNDDVRRARASLTFAVSGRVIHSSRARRSLAAR